MGNARNRRLWIGWAVCSLVASVLLAVALVHEASARLPVLSSVRAWLLPGPTTHGHHQIELACEACHASPFGGREALQEACMGCHGAALAGADDKHPASKFNDPRNAFRLAKIDAQQCVTCHVEHRPHITQAMGVTQPRDYCFHCHGGPDEMPPDHSGFPFDGCTAAGCHNYHDNRALYEDFLLKHANDPALLPRRELPRRDLLAGLGESMSYPHERYPLQPLSTAGAGAPRPIDRRIHDDWLASAHARGGVDCVGCHAGPAVAEGAPAAWDPRPATPQACTACHAAEVQSFGEGRHGMRLRQGLGAMTPGAARLPMRGDAAHAALDCTSCHRPHRDDTRAAAVDACLGCHADPHSLAYKDSPHARLWAREGRAELPGGAGVSCASCHMPRVRIATEEGSRMGVQHNQNDTLQPNEKMARPVCMHCHGLGFTLDALADPLLVARNFSGAPSRRVQSIDMALKKDRDERARRATPRPTP